MRAHDTRLAGILLAATALLLVPLVAMQFTDEVNWDLADFIVAGVLLFGTGLTYELAARTARPRAYRVAVGLALGAALVLVWVNLAVGLIGSEDHPANLMYFGVLALGVAGAAVGRFRAHAMARVLFCVALAQALVPVIALMIWRPRVTSVDELVGILGVFALNTIFVLLFVGSALSFRRAGRASSHG
jgi:hypothetical protein